MRLNIFRSPPKIISWGFVPRFFASRKMLGCSFLLDFLMSKHIRKTEQVSTPAYQLCPTAILFHQSGLVRWDLTKPNTTIHSTPCQAWRGSSSAAFFYRDLLYFYSVRNCLQFKAICRCLLTECPHKAEAHAPGLNVVTDQGKLWCHKGAFFQYWNMMDPFWVVQ